MVPCMFTCLVSMISGPAVTFSCSETIETILIAEDGKNAGKSLSERGTIANLGILGKGHPST